MDINCLLLGKIWLRKDKHRSRYC